MPDGAQGVIYILTNPSFPEYVKIGYANNLESRLKQLNRSECVPFAFRAYATYEVSHRLSDRELHALIDKLNPDLRSVDEVNGRTRVKEFFAMSAEDAYEILEAIANISGTADKLHRVTPTGEEIQEEQTAREISSESRLGPFRFSYIGLEPGDTIRFVNNPEITAIVVDDRHIQMGKETTSLSAAATQILGCGHSVAGPRYWTYEGRILADIRNEMEE